MPSKQVESTTATLSYAQIHVNQLLKLSCQRCRTALDILQPNQNRPYQFLAVCADCGAWYRVETQAGDSRGVMINLPEVTPLLPAVAAAFANPKVY